MLSQSRKTPRKKTRAELNEEGRNRKRLKKHRGHRAGSRTNATDRKTKTTNTRPLPDPRLGSKKPIDLSPNVLVTPKKEANEITALNKTEKARQELAELENNQRLDQLLIQLEKNVILSDEEQQYVNQCLDRIEQLMIELGIELDDEEEEAEKEQRMDIMHLLR